MRWLKAPLLALLCLINLAAQVRAGEPEIWFNPFSRGDWLNLWSDDAPWQLARSRTKVIAIANWWLTVGTDAQLLAIFHYAKRHNIKVEMEIGTVARYPTDQCGANEGHTAPSAVAAQMAVLARLDIHIDIMTMDEPLWFGHYATDSTACKLSIPDLVDRVAANYTLVAAQNPGLQLVQIEPIPTITNFPDWRDKLSDFQTRMTKKTGAHIRDLQLDVGWDTPAWVQPMRDLREFTRQRNMGLGFYMYGGSSDQSDAEWIANAIKHMETVEGLLGIIPDQAIFASWSRYPVNTMPETSPTTLTWLINRYSRERTILDARFSGSSLRGKLTTTMGKPIVNATINGYVPGVDFSLPLPRKVVTGVVPPTAVTGLIGYRLNAECNCVGFNDVLVGQLQYQETSGGTRSFGYILPFTRQVYKGAVVTSESVGGVPVNRVTTTPAQSFLANSAFFPVTPGATFTYTVPASTIGGQGWYGHALLLWFDQNMRGVPGASFVSPDSDRRLMSTATTAADGTFELRRFPRVGPASLPVTIEYPGDDTYRGAGWTPFR